MGRKYYLEIPMIVELVDCFLMFDVFLLVTPPEFPSGWSCCQASACSPGQAEHPQKGQKQEGFGMIWNMYEYVMSTILGIDITTNFMGNTKDRINHQQSMFSYPAWQKSTDFHTFIHEKINPVRKKTYGSSTGWIGLFLTVLDSILGLDTIKLSWQCYCNLTSHQPTGRISTVLPSGKLT